MNDLPTGTQPQPVQVVAVSTKNAGLGIALAVLFGPLGLLYSTIAGAIVMFFVNIVVAFFTLGFGLILTWPICGVWAYIACKNYNARLLAGATRV